MVASGWRRLSIAELAEINPPRPIRSGEVVPFVEMAAVRTDLPHVDYLEERSATGSGSRFTNGDTLFARITPCTENGKTSFVDYLAEGAVGMGSTEFIVLAPRRALVEPRYLYWLARSDMVRKPAISSMVGTSGRQRVPPQIFTEITVPVPPLAEQRRISEILTSVDDAKQATEAAIEQTRKVKQGLLQELLTRGAGHTRFKRTEIGEVPEGWEVWRLEQLGVGGAPVLRTGPFGSMLKSEHFTDSGRPVLTIQCLGTGEILPDGLFYTGDDTAQALRDYEVKAGDLVFSRVADVGRSVVIPAWAEGWIISSNLMRISVDQGRVDPHYLMYQLTAGLCITRQLGSVVADGGRQIVSSAVVKGLRFPIPPLEEQRRIAEQILFIDARIRAEQATADQLVRLKEGLLQDLLTGQLMMSTPGQVSLAATQST